MVCGSEVVMDDDEELIQILEETYWTIPEQESQEEECSCMGGCMYCLGMSWSDFL